MPSFRHGKTSVAPTTAFVSGAATIRQGERSGAARTNKLIKRLEIKIFWKKFQVRLDGFVEQPPPNPLLEKEGGTELFLQTTVFPDVADLVGVFVENGWIEAFGVVIYIFSKKVQLHYFVEFFAPFNLCAFFSELSTVCIQYI